MLVIKSEVLDFRCHDFICVKIIKLIINSLQFFINYKHYYNKYEFFIFQHWSMGWFHQRYFSKRIQEHSVKPWPVQQTGGACLLPPVCKDRRGHRLPQRDGVCLQVYNHIQTSILGAQWSRQDVRKAYIDSFFIWGCGLNHHYNLNSKYLSLI